MRAGLVRRLRALALRAGHEVRGAQPEVAAAVALRGVRRSLFGFAGQFVSPAFNYSSLSVGACGRSFRGTEDRDPEAEQDAQFAYPEADAVFLLVGAERRGVRDEMGDRELCLTVARRG